MRAPTPESPDPECRACGQGWRRPTVVQYDATMAFAGDWHIQDWICRSCSYDWRVAEVFGESEFVMDKGELKRKDGRPMDM